MIDLGATGCPRYEEERSLGLAALEAGRLEEAREHFGSALATARQHGDLELVDRATCNEAAVAISLGEIEAPVPALREVLMRNLSDENAFLAAYNISQALQQQTKKSLFYARIARDRAELTGRKEWLASALNRIANCQLADSLFEDASENYRRAIALVPIGDSSRELIYLANLAYAEIMLGRLGKGFRLLYHCLRTARRQQWRRLEMIAHIDLGYAYLQRGRLGRAERHVARGLRLAEEVGERGWIVNALYLAGEVAVQLGQSAAGRAHFSDLQRRFFPDHGFLPEFLVKVDIRQVINLRA